MIGIVMIRIGVLVLTLGMIAGMAMGMAQNFMLAPAHAHLNLVGGVLMFMFGLYYRLVPGAADGVLPKVQATLHIIGAILFPAGIAAVLTYGPGMEILPISGGIVVLLATILFAVVAFRRQPA
jgi:hypothetical protein